MLVSDGDRVPIGYSTLAATSIAFAELPAPLATRLRRSWDGWQLMPAISNKGMES